MGLTSTGAGFLPVQFGATTYRVYDNANLSVYSAQTCNARCPFCVEELRPLSRGVELESQKRVLSDDDRYFEALDRALVVLGPVAPSVSITGGEPSLDPRLPEILATLRRHAARKLTMTTNGSGLLNGISAGGDVLERVLAAEPKHLNISRAHPDERINQRIMAIRPFHSNEALREIVMRANGSGVRVRLSCVLLNGYTETLQDCVAYLEWAASLGVDNVVFRQLMQVDPATVRRNYVTRFSDQRRAPMAPLLESIHPSGGLPGDSRFSFIRQVLGYYYYVEVYRYEGTAGAVDVCIEGADLSIIERDRQRPGNEDVVHELIFHPDATLSSTWQPWDGVLLPAP